MKKRFFFFLVIPFLVILVYIYYLDKFNKEIITAKFEEITTAEGITIKKLLETSGFHLAMDSPESTVKLTKFMDELYKNESIVYIGLFNNRRLIYLLSRFEGFFPVVPGQQDYRILDSPIGKIFQITAHFKEKNNNTCQLHIGFDYSFLNTFQAAAGKNFLTVIALFSLLLLAVMILVIYFDKKFYRKELELFHSNQEKERFRELSLLTAEIAHEIKNPLNSIYLSFNVLEKYISSEPDALFYKDAVKNEIKRINDILQSYSSLSKKIAPDFQQVDLPEFTREFSLFMEQEIKSRQIDFKINLEGKKNIGTDRNILKQILLNLIKNSIEGEAASITVTFKATGKELSMDIWDNGKGIDKDLAPSIFKPYISTKTKGMGLGLHISRRLVQALGGEIKSLSFEPGNTAFRVSLPEPGTLRHKSSGIE